jgi:hypothetical protein
MLYVVEIRRERQELSTIMARIREWLDRQRFEPDAFYRGQIGPVVQFFSAQRSV